MGKPRDVSEAWRMAPFRSVLFNGAEGMTLSNAPPPTGILYIEEAGPVPPADVSLLLDAAADALRQGGSFVLLCRHRERRDHAKAIIAAAMPGAFLRGSDVH